MCRTGGPRCEGSGGRRNTQASEGTRTPRRGIRREFHPEIGGAPDRRDVVAVEWTDPASGDTLRGKIISRNLDKGTAKVEWMPGTEPEKVQLSDPKMRFMTADEAAPTSPPEQAATRSTVPTRQDADRLAAAYDPNATGWDGKPLNERDRRMYALRDSGWTGPIDQDGYPATTGDAADTLRYMARQRGENPDW